MSDQHHEPVDTYLTTPAERIPETRSAPAWAWAVIEDALRFAMDSAPEITDTDYQAAYVALQLQTEAGPVKRIGYEELKARPAWKDVHVGNDGALLPWLTTYECDNGHGTQRWPEYTELQDQSSHCPVCDAELESTYAGESCAQWVGPTDPLEVMLWMRLANH